MSDTDGLIARLQKLDCVMVEVCTPHPGNRASDIIPVEREKLLAALSSTRPEPVGASDWFWLVLQEPGCVPERKGPWKHTETARVLREFMAARPTAYIYVLTLGDDGTPDVDHGPQTLQMLDGRSMATGRAHNAQTRDAHAEYHATPTEARPALSEEQDVADSLDRIADRCPQPAWQASLRATAMALRAAISPTRQTAD